MSYIKSSLHQGTKFVLDLGNYALHSRLLTYKSSSQQSLMQRPGLNFGFRTSCNRTLMCCLFTPVLTSLIHWNVYYILCSLSEPKNFFPSLFLHCLLSLWNNHVPSRVKPKDNSDVSSLHFFNPGCFLMF